jgi:hypothetical protein
MKQKNQHISVCKVPFINFGKSYQEIKQEVLKEIDCVLLKGDLILRDDVEKFEQNFAKFVGTKYCVGVNSGTDALYLALKAIGIVEEDYVAVPSHTFVATAQVVNQLGGIVNLYDLDGKINHDNLNKAIMVAHIAGELTELPKTKLPIIEDACQALGSLKNPKTAAQCWSFYPAKILGGYGDAGALTTNSKKIYDEVKELRNHYKKNYSKWGINSRLDNIQAAILNIKLKRISQVLKRRKEIAEMYLEGLKDVIGLPDNTQGRVWQDFIVKTEKRNKLFNFLKDEGIETMKNEYPMPCSKLPLAKDYENKTLRIPCNETLSDSEIDYVIKKIKEFFKK